MLLDQEWKGMSNLSFFFLFQTLPFLLSGIFFMVFLLCWLLCVSVSMLIRTDFNSWPFWGIDSCCENVVTVVGDITSLWEMVFKRMLTYIFRFIRCTIYNSHSPFLVCFYGWWGGFDLGYVNGGWGEKYTWLMHCGVLIFLENIIWIESCS